VLQSGKGVPLTLMGPGLGPKLSARHESK